MTVSREQLERDRADIDAALQSCLRRYRYNRVAMHLNGAVGCAELVYAYSLMGWWQTGWAVVGAVLLAASLMHWQFTILYGTDVAVLRMGRTAIEQRLRDLASWE